MLLPTLQSTPPPLVIALLSLAVLDLLIFCIQGLRSMCVSTIHLTSSFNGQNHLEGHA